MVMMYFFIYVPFNAELKAHKVTINQNIVVIFVPIYLLL